MERLGNAMGTPPERHPHTLRRDCVKQRAQMEVLKNGHRPDRRRLNSLMTAGAAVGLAATAFFVMLAGFQYMSAGGSVRAVESAKGSLYNALIGFAIVILCRVVAGLVGSALGAPGAGG